MYPKLRITCPLCAKRFYLAGAAEHTQKFHSDITESEFEAALIKELVCGRLKYADFVPPPGDMVNATDRLQQVKRVSKLGVRNIVSGGKAGA